MNSRLVTRSDAMADDKSALTDYLRQVGLEPDFLRAGVRLLTELLMELEVEEQIGAGLYERTADRTTYRNGYRPRTWETRVGEIMLEIPKLRKGTYFPSFLEARRPAERALVAVVQQAYINGVSTRKVDELVQAMGLEGMDKSKVSRMCQELDTVVEEFQNRPLEGRFPYVWLDALYLKVRQNHRIVNRTVVIAIGVRETGERQVLGFAVGGSEEKDFWREFLRSLIRRGLSGVELVISDSHEGLKAAQAEVLAGATWQRCRVHFMRNVLAQVPKGDKTVVAAVLRTVFAQANRDLAGKQLEEAVRFMRSRWPKAADVVAAAEDDVLAYMAFPKEHWTRIYSTNPLERLNKEVKRRTRVVEVFPTDGSVERLVGTVLLEIDDEWQVARRYFSLESMNKVLEPDGQAVLVADPGPLRLEPIR
jgi:transposase-like protein